MSLNRSFLGFMTPGDMIYSPPQRKREATFRKNPGWPPRSDVHHPTRWAAISRVSFHIRKKIVTPSKIIFKVFKTFRKHHKSKEHNFLLRYRCKKKSVIEKIDFENKNKILIFPSFPCLALTKRSPFVKDSV